MSFSIDAQESGGTALWTESHPDEVLTAGVYSVLLGETNPIGSNGNQPDFFGKAETSGNGLALPEASAPYALCLLDMYRTNSGLAAARLSYYCGVEVENLPSMWITYRPFLL